MQANDAEAARSEARPSPTWPIWLALVVALSPAIVDAGRLASEQWWARPAVILAALAIACMLRSDAQAPTRRAPGIPLVALSVAFVLIAAGARMIRLARPAVPVAVLGMALTLGRPSVASAALLFFAVAPPRVAMDALPGLHTWLGPQALVESPDGGLPLAMWLAGLAAHAGVRRGEGTPAVAARALRGALCAIPIQLGALALAEALSRSGSPGAARALLSHAVWIGSGAGLVWLQALGERRRRSSV